jgi:hypothetical protein
MTRTAIIEAFDPRADGRRRLVEVTQNQIVIARRLGGVDMRVALEPRHYQGVLLSVLVSEATDFLYQVRLVHADAELNVTLSEGGDETEARAQWRRWAETLRLPRLVERAEGEYENDCSPAAPHPFERRRGRATLRRRNRFLVRRKMGRPVLPPGADALP